jgi:hypothetical protein
MGSEPARGERVKIPKRVNTAWDWVDKHIRILRIIAVLVVAALTSLWLPALAALVVGVFVGGVAVQRRMMPRVRRLRAEVDDLLRENGALRHEKTVLASGVIAAQSQPTTALLVIPEAEPKPSDQETKRLKILPSDFFD